MRTINNSSSNITTVGTITSGEWNASTVTNNYIDCGLNDGQIIKLIENVNVGEYAFFENNGVKGKTISELKTDLALTHSDIDLSAYSGSSSITNLGTITSGAIWNGEIIEETYIDSNIARKSYVDNVAQGLDIKDAVKVTTTANITLSGTKIIDGISVGVDDRVLVKNQTTGKENGIYLVKSSTWERASDLDTGITATSGIFTFVEQGITYGSSGWVLTTNSGIVGTDDLTFTQFSGAGSTVSASNGITVNGSGQVILDTPSNVKSILNYIDNSDLSTFIGSSNITTLGTIGSGAIWQGSPITDTYISSASTWNDKQNSLTFGISDRNSVIIDGIANEDNYAIFTANGIKGQNTTNLKTDLNLNLVENTSLSTWNGSSNISSVGTVSSGIWQAAITDTYINSATTWNNKQDALTFTSSGLTSGKEVVIMNGTANQDNIAVFTAYGIKGSDYEY